MCIQIKASTSLSLEDKEVISYGGMAKLYVDKDSKHCYKVYKRKTKPEVKSLIRANLAALADIKCPSSLVTPDALYLDDEGNLIAQEMRYIEGETGYRCFHELPLPKQIKIIEILIDLMLELSKYGFIVSDLKLNNLLWDKGSALYSIDHDFTFYQSVPDEVKEFLSTNNSITNYCAAFGDLKPMYNLYRLYFILARLLISMEEYSFIQSITPTKRNVREETVSKALNYFIQKNRGLPQEFKMQMRNLFTGNHEISFSKDLKEDLILSLKRHNQS